MSVDANERASEIAKAMQLGARNLKFALTHLIEIEKGIDSPLSRTGDSHPDETISVLIRLLFGNTMTNFVDGDYSFPEPRSRDLLSNCRPSIEKAGFEDLYSLLPYFLTFRRCFGQLDDDDLDRIYKCAFWVYSTDVVPLVADEEEWQRLYGRPLMERKHSVENAIGSWFFRERRLSRVLSSDELEQSLNRAAREVCSTREMVFVNRFTPRLAEGFFVTAHGCLDRLGTIASVFSVK